MSQKEETIFEEVKSSLAGEALFRGGVCEELKCPKRAISGLESATDEFEKLRLAYSKQPVLQSSKLACVNHMMLSAAFMRRWDITRSNALVSQCIQFCLENGIEGMDFELVGNSLLLNRERLLVREEPCKLVTEKEFQGLLDQAQELLNLKVECARWMEATVPPPLKRQKAFTSTEPIVDFSAYAPTSVRIEYRDHVDEVKLPTIAEIMEVDSTPTRSQDSDYECCGEIRGVQEEVPAYEFSCCGLFESCQGPKIVDPKVDVDIGCCNSNVHGQDAINLTSGEAKNPGPNVVVKGQLFKGKGKKGKGGRPKSQKSAKLVSDALAPKQSGFKGRPKNMVGPLLPNGAFSKKGKGDYADDVGSGIGGWLGKKAVGLFKNVFGLGAYHAGPDVESNAMVAGTSPPKITNDAKQRSFIFRHREYVAGVQSSINFVNTVYAMNPGQYKTFPWLAPMAANFEEWKALGMLIEFKSLVSPIASDSSGQVIISTEYNPNKPLFTSSVQALNAEYATSCKPYECMLHAIECEPSEIPVNVLQVRIGSLPAGQDLRFYDLCNVQVMTEGQADALTEIGQLWVTYEIAFLKPIYDSGLGLQLLTDHWYCTSLASAATFGALQNLRGGSLLGTTITGSGTVINFPTNINTGEYLITLNCWLPGNATQSAPTITPLKCSLVSLWNNGANSYFISPIVTSANNQYTSLSFVVSINAPGSSFATVTVTGMTYSSNTGVADLIISQINGAILT